MLINIVFQITFAIRTLTTAFTIELLIEFGTLILTQYCDLNVDLCNGKFFKYFWKNVKYGFTGTWQILKGTKSWISVSIVPNLWKSQCCSYVVCKGELPLIRPGFLRNLKTREGGNPPAGLSRSYGHNFYPISPKMASKDFWHNSKLQIARTPCTALVNRKPLRQAMPVL